MARKGRVTPMSKNASSNNRKISKKTKINDSEIALLHSIFQSQWLSAAGYRIAGGTDEILRNIVAERVLGLPQDVRVDKSVPFNELPSGR